MNRQLNGKKTYIGIAGLVLVKLLEDQGWLPYDTTEQLTTIFLGITGVGVAHKLDKAKAKDED